MSLPSLHTGIINIFLKSKRACSLSMIDLFSISFAKLFLFDNIRTLIDSITTKHCFIRLPRVDHLFNVVFYLHLKMRGTVIINCIILVI